MKTWKTAIVGMLSLAPLAGAGPRVDDVKELDRMKNAGTVIQEILDIPDDIPRDTLDKARCVIVLPSVLKAAFIAGGSYGRGISLEGSTIRPDDDANHRVYGNGASAQESSKTPNTPLRMRANKW